MQGGYPRFFIHPIVSTLAECIAKKFDSPSVVGGPPQIQQDPPRMAMLFPSRQRASHCEQFLLDNAKDTKESRITTLPLSVSSSRAWSGHDYHVTWSHLEFYAVLYPSDLFSLAKLFWQHTGFGISSRYAECCLQNINKLGLFDPHAMNSYGLVEHLLEVLGIKDDKKCKDTLRRRIASEKTSLGRHVVSRRDVFLYPSGMCAITNMAEAILAMTGNQETCKVVIYG